MKNLLTLVYDVDQYVWMIYADDADYCMLWIDTLWQARTGTGKQWQHSD